VRLNLPIREQLLPRVASLEQVAWSETVPEAMVALVQARRLLTPRPASRIPLS